MSASWASEVARARIPLLAGALAFVLILDPAASHAATDTSRIVRHVRIGPAGIRIEESGGAGGRHERVGRHARGTLRVGPTGVSVVDEEADSAGAEESVTVHGPGVIVNAGNAGLVRVFADAEVPAGRRVDGDVVAVFGSVDVAGSVAGDVVSVFGSVRLRPGARVDGDAVAIGGVLDHPSTATVGGESVALGIMAPGWGIPTLPALLGFVLLGWLVTMFLSWMLVMLFPERLQNAAMTASRHTAGSFFLGVLSAPLFVIALVLLFVTVVGIPLALLLPLVYVLAIWAGQIAASYLLGCKVLRRRPGTGGMMGAIAAGTMMVGMFFVAGAALAIPSGVWRTFSLFFTLLGVLLIAGLSTIGTGALLLSRGGARPPAGLPGTASAAPGAAMPAVAPPLP